MASSSSTGCAASVDSELRFYRSESPFSNFHRSPIIIDGLEYATVEHYYQAMKFEDPVYRERVRKADTPLLAKRLGSTMRTPIRLNWNVVREDVMTKGLKAKFAQNPVLLQILLKTGNKRLVEASPTDYYWGCGANNTGQNRLGVLLMQERALYQ